MSYSHVLDLHQLFSPEPAAQGIFDGIKKGEEDIFPDPASLSVAEGWRMGVAKTLDGQDEWYCEAMDRLLGQSHRTQSNHERASLIR